MNHSLPTAREAIAWSARAKETLAAWCWACDDFRADYCECGAPEWDGRVESGIVTCHGVYIIQATCGLVKIGASGVNMAKRVATLAGKYNTEAEGIAPLACLPGATFSVEYWLHDLFCHTRDMSWAQAEGLPNYSEWFWPTPALRALVAGDAFMDLLTPEFIR